MSVSWRLYAFAALKLAIFLVIASFYGGKLLTAAKNVSGPSEFHLEWFCLSAGLGGLGYCCLPLGLRQLLCSCGRPLGAAQSVALYFIPASTKYVPGKVWPTMLSLGLGRRFGFALTEALSAVLLLNLAVLLGALIVGSAALHPVLPIPSFLLMGLIFAVASPKESHSNWLVKRFRLPNLPSRSVLVFATSAAVGFWLLVGLGSCFLLWSLGFHLPFAAFFRLIGALALTALAGIAAPFAPGGLGVREVLLNQYLEGMLPGSEPTLAPACLRLWQMGIEGIWLLVGLVILRFQSSGDSIAYGSYES